MHDRDHNRADGGRHETLGLPGWVPGAALILFLIGLPIVLATAFVQEGAPKATEYYARFVELWRGADPDLRPRVDAAQQRLRPLVGRKG